jgi:hypothetical protein
MWSHVEPILLRFRPCFSRRSAFYWFSITLCGFIIRLDHLGASSFVRWLFLNPNCYELMLRFFRADSWNLKTLLSYWVGFCMESFPAVEFNGRRLLIGDTTKVGKEAERMPGVKTLHQESEDNGKPEYIRGHHFGFVGILVGSLSKAFCVPLQGELQEGVEQLRPGEPFGDKAATLITRMARLVLAKAKQTGCLCYAVLDAYYCVGPFLLILKAAVDEQGQQRVHVIVRAKKNYVGYYLHRTSRKKTGEYRKVALRDTFDFPHLFKEAQCTIYGQVKTVRYFCMDLLWKPVHDFIRFICVIDGESRYILMSTDLDLPAEQIITIYSYRFKIEVMFFAIKHLIGALRYHFWTKSMPKMAGNTQPDYSSLSDSRKDKCGKVVEAIERFVNLGAIALGILQYLALTLSDRIWQSYRGWLRTYSSDIPSEGVVQSVLQSEFFSARKVPDCRTLQLIMRRGREYAFRAAA